MDALHEFLSNTDRVPDLWADSGHDAHAQAHIAEVCELDSDTGQRAAEGAHAERDYVQVTSWKQSDRAK